MPGGGACTNARRCYTACEATSGRAGSETAVFHSEFDTNSSCLVLLLLGIPKQTECNTVSNMNAMLTIQQCFRCWLSLKRLATKLTDQGFSTMVKKDQLQESMSPSVVVVLPCAMVVFTPAVGAMLDCRMKAFSLRWL